MSREHDAETKRKIKMGNFIAQTKLNGQNFIEADYESPLISSNRRIAIITSCSKKKLDHGGPAWLVNRGQLLRLVIDYSNLVKGDLFILSAKYGLIDAEKRIEPYNQKLRTKQDISQIQEQANNELGAILSLYDRIVIIMGRFYRSVFYDLSDEKIQIIDDERGIGGYYQKVCNLIKDAANQYGYLDEGPIKQSS